MKTLSLHEWQSVPGSIKPTSLAQHCHTVINPKLPDEGFDEAVGIAQASSTNIDHRSSWGRAGVGPPP